MGRQRRLLRLRERDHAAPSQHRGQAVGANPAAHIIGAIVDFGDHVAPIPRVLARVFDLAERRAELGMKVGGVVRWSDGQVEIYKVVSVRVVRVGGSRW